MFSFILTIIKFLRAFVRGLHDHEFRVIFYSLVSLLVGGTLFYAAVEGWGIIDSLYFSVMTLSTVGYGDFHPSTALGKIFTVIYIVVGAGIFIAFVTKIAAQRDIRPVGRGARAPGEESDEPVTDR
jgi:hypothetical protein